MEQEGIYHSERNFRKGAITGMLSVSMDMRDMNKWYFRLQRSSSKALPWMLNAALSAPVIATCGMYANEREWND